MTYGKRNHLNTFIIDSPHITYDHFTLVGYATLLTTKSLQTSICSKRLEIPLYHTVENMFFNLDVASLHKGYGYHLKK
jgi:hypothetical protein